MSNNHRNWQNPPYPFPVYGFGIGQSSQVSAVGGGSVASTNNPGVHEVQIEKGSLENTFKANVILVDRCEDLLRSLMKQGGGNELFILGATGSLSYVELLNDDEDPVENTILNGKNMEIVFMDGNLVPPKKNDKNRASHVTVLVSGAGEELGQLRGGPVKSIITKTPVQVVLGDKSRTDITSIAESEYPGAGKLSPNMELTSVAHNQIYKATLKALNPPKPK